MYSPASFTGQSPAQHHHSPQQENRRA